ncbi:methyl-accepting chemotaxis protein [Thalassolituus oleivorans]|uniref:methyl-accepting chemotaxis protein n=1 Tax=Thalassolituus oleivorans TaxID=187493 RepID=UPI0023F146AB|nr:PAS domain-containing methyl-accepting chemotaxis protein [Thalassolituus oleivorans]
MSKYIKEPDLVITELQGQDELLVQAVKRLIALEKALQSAHAVAEFGLDGKILSVNSRFKDLFGLDNDEIKTKTHDDLCRPQDLGNPEHQQFWEVLVGGGCVSQDFPRVTSDGWDIYVHASYTPVLGDNGKPISIYMEADDITQKRVIAYENAGKVEAITRTQAVAEFALDGTIKAANDKYLEIVGYSKLEIIGKHHRMLCHDEHAISKDYEKFWEDLKAGKPVAGEFRRAHKNGKAVWLSASYSPIHDDEGRIIKIFKVAKDITIEKIRALEEEGKMTAINKNLAVIEFDMDGIVLSANDTFLQIMGYEAKQAIGHHHRIFCDNDLMESQEYSDMWQDLNNGISHSGEFMRLDCHNSAVWLQGTYTPIFDMDGHPYKIVKYAYNITDAKRKSLEDDGKVAAIGRSHGVIEFDMSGNILDANEEFLKLIGYELDELVNQHHRILVDQEEASSNAYRAFWNKLGKGTYEAGDYLRIGKNGRRVWIAASYNPILDLQGRPVKVVKYCRDITTEKINAIEVQTKMDAVSSSNCIMDLSRDGTIISVNDDMQKVLGFSRNEIIGKPESSFMFDDDKGSPVHLDLWRKLREGVAITGEFRLKVMGDREVWLGATLSPVMGLDGLLTKAIFIGRDITSNKIAQLDADGKLSAISRSQCVIEFDLQGKIISANNNFLDLMDYSIEEVRGHHHRMFVSPSEIASIEYQSFWERLGRGEHESGEYKRVGKGGKEFWLQATYNPVFDPRGNPIKVVKFATDITDAKLKSSEFEAKVAAISLGQMVIEFDLTGNVLSANRNFLAAMGYTLREIQGQHHSAFCSSDYTQSAEYRDFWLSLNEGKFISGRFHRFGKFNRNVWIQATYNPILDLNGEVVKVVKYAYDVTKEVELEQALSTKSLEMSECVSRLVSSISDICNHSLGATETAKMSTSAAAEGNEALQKSISAINRIQSSSSKVSEIVSIISEIANQTNLLAFNAAIEAARAGQHGVGFSVVAAEVRKLAERSSDAARQISDLIKASVEEVQRGVSVSTTASKSFEGIINQLGTLVKTVDQISLVANHQHDYAKDVSDVIEDLRKILDK